MHQIGGQFAGGVLAQAAGLGREDGQVPHPVVQQEPAAQRLGPAVGNLLQHDAREVGTGAGDPRLPHPGASASIQAPVSLPSATHAGA
ncbi:hypothetical protein ACWC4C_38685 [Streptomyces olivaceoviridis]